MRPLVKTDGFKEPTEELIAAWMEVTQLPREEAIARMNAHHDQTEMWVNETYQVQVTRIPDHMTQLNIRRRDGKVILRDWRDFQEIKNQICGPECEAIELYPAESRLVDTTNKYHLWVVEDPTFRFPVGWDKRDVSSKGGHAPGLRQRPIPKDKLR